MDGRKLRAVFSTFNHPGTGDVVILGANANRVAVSFNLNSAQFSVMAGRAVGAFPDGFTVRTNYPTQTFTRYPELEGLLIGDTITAEWHSNNAVATSINIVEVVAE